MTTITVRNVGAYGFNTTPLNGIGLSTAEAATTRSDVEQALALADALRAAMQAARQAGLQSFAPAQAVAAGVLTLPASLSTANRDAFFANVMGRAYAGGPVSLDQWSQAVDALEHWAGATASMLPPGAGGGTRNVRGTWYVNGEPWSLSELFTVNRVNTLSEIDRMVADSLNVIAANNDAAKALTGLMEKLFKKYYENQWDSTTSRYTKVSKSWVNAVGTLDQDAVSISGRNPWTEGNERISSDEGAPAIDYSVNFDRLLEYAEKHIGPGTMISKMGTAGTTYPDGNPGVATGLGKEDFRAMIDEVEQILGAFSADNQVAQLRNETLFNSRSNLLEGLGTFLKGQQTTRSTLARNA
jgi:hypothetical protein